MPVAATRRRTLFGLGALGALPGNGMAQTSRTRLILLGTHNHAAHRRAGGATISDAEARPGADVTGSSARTRRRSSVCDPPGTSARPSLPRGAGFRRAAADENAMKALDAHLSTYLRPNGVAAAG